MSTLLTEIKAKLDAIGTLGTITMSSMPATPDEVGTIYEYGGQNPERRFGVTGVGYEKPAIQIVFRGKPFDAASPRAKADIAWRALMAVQPGALGAGVTTEYLTIDPQQSPFPTQPPDINNRPHSGFNAYVMKVPS